MKKITLILSIIFILTLSYFGILRPNFTGNLIDGMEHAYTKAICNQTICEDHFIECKGKKLTKITPTGQTIKNKNHPIELIDNKNLCD